MQRTFRSLPEVLRRYSGIGTSSAGRCIWPIHPLLASNSARPAGRSPRRERHEQGTLLPFRLRDPHVLRTYVGTNFNRNVTRFFKLPTRFFKFPLSFSEHREINFMIEILRSCRNLAERLNKILQLQSHMFSSVPKN